MKNKQPKKFKEMFGRNPWDPWSAKANIAEDRYLDAYLKSRGFNPQYMDREQKSAHSRSTPFLQWKRMRMSSGQQMENLEIFEADKTTLEETQLKEGSLHDWFGKEKWVRMDTKGNIKGKCAREPGEGKPKCLPQAKAQSLGKEGRAKAASRKRREDPNPSRSGKAINVKTESVEYLDEKKDACYHKVKSRYKVWPSAYASGALVKCRKKGAKNWGTKSEEQDTAELHSKNVHKHISDLTKRVHVHKPQGTVKTEQTQVEPNESVLYDAPEGTLTRVNEYRRQLSKSARMIKSLYKKHRMTEDLYDHEKDDKNPAKVHGKAPKFEKADEKESKGENKPQAAATLKGGKTMTGQERDTIEIDPMMRNRPGQPDITKKDDKKDDKKDEKRDDKKQ
jgi:hypothetical protein